MILSEQLSTYLVAITVVSSKNLLLTFLTAIGTVVGNLVETMQAKADCMNIFCGFSDSFSSAILCATC